MNKEIITLPNGLSVLRLVIAGILPYLIVNQHFIVGAILFAIGAFTDLFDGVLARKRNKVTSVGKILDPIADKLLVLGAFIAFWYVQLVPLWMFIVIAIRAVLVTSVRLWLVRKGKIIAAIWSGKIKTISQITAISFLFLFTFVQLTVAEPAFFIITQVLLWISVFFTVYSGIDFFLKNHAAFPFIQHKFKEYIRDITSLANPVVLLLFCLILLGWTKDFGIIVAAIVTGEIIGSAIKTAFPKARPNKQTYKNLVEKIDAGSFPSIHASRAAIVFLSLLFLTATGKILLFILYPLLIIAIGYSRVVLKKHYWTDVIAGWILGTIIFYLFHISLVHSVLSFI